MKKNLMGKMDIFIKILLMIMASCMLLKISSNNLSFTIKELYIQLTFLILLFLYRFLNCNKLIVLIIFISFIPIVNQYSIYLFPQVNSSSKYLEPTSKSLLVDEMSGTVVVDSTLQRLLNKKNLVSFSKDIFICNGIREPYYTLRTIRTVSDDRVLTKSQFEYIKKMGNEKINMIYNGSYSIVFVYSANENITEVECYRYGEDIQIYMDLDTLRTVLRR